MDSGAPVLDIDYGTSPTVLGATSAALDPVSDFPM
jgi:hypothetical protein